MNRGLIIQCGGCAFGKSIDLNGEAEDIEERVNGTIESGWRYVKRWGEFMCPECCKKGLDPLYVAGFGNPRIAGRLESYKALVERTAIQLVTFRELDALVGDR